MTFTRLMLRAIGLPKAFYSWFVYQLNGRDSPSQISGEDRQLHIKELMTSTRIMLGAIGLLGFLAWGLYFWLIYKMKGLSGGPSSLVSGEEWFVLLVTMMVYVFYLIITIHAFRAITALVVGVVVHILFIFFVIIPLLQADGAGPFFFITFLPGLVLWLTYVRQLSRHQNAV